MNMISRLPLWSLSSAIGFVAACGSKGSNLFGSEQVTCGPGTALVGEQCVTSSADADATDGAAESTSPVLDAAAIDASKNDAQLSDAGSAGEGGAITDVASEPIIENLCGDVQIPTDKTIPAGTKTVICAGSTVSLGAKVNIIVQGTLEIDGTEAQPVSFQPMVGASTAWNGITVQNGATLAMSHATVKVGFDPVVTAAPGSSYVIDYLEATSVQSMILLLESTGTVSHSKLHCNNVPHGIEIKDASPKITDVLLDVTSSAIALVAIDGASAAPSFDHVDIGFAQMMVSQGGTGVVITNGGTISMSHSTIHGIGSGIVVNATQSAVFDSDNLDNPSDFVQCDHSADVRINDCYIKYSNDSSCGPLQLTITNSQSAPLTDVGPRF